MPKRSCFACGKLVEHGSRCSRWPRRFNQAKRGSGRRYTPFRRCPPAITGGVCAVWGFDDQAEAHHLGPAEIDGGVCLCQRCHGRVSAAEDRARAMLRER